MPVFDECGPRPVGLQGPRENPVTVAALSIGRGGYSSTGGAGRHEPPEAEGAPAEATALGSAQEGAAPEAHAAGAEGGEQPPAVHGAEASEASAAFLDGSTGDAHQADTPDAGRPDASSSSQADPCAQLLGRFCMDFEALRKRQKYFAIDE